MVKLSQQSFGCGRSSDRLLDRLALLRVDFARHGVNCSHGADIDVRPHGPGKAASQMATGGDFNAFAGRCLPGLVRIDAGSKWYMAESRRDLNDRDVRCGRIVWRRTR